MRTYTVVHPSGVTFSTYDIDEAAQITGWGWMPSTDDDRPVGVDLSGARTKADLAAYADSLLIDLAGASTRAEIEERITTWHGGHT